MYNFRQVSELDTEAVLKIYEPYIETPVTFECELPSLEEFQKRIYNFSCNYPYIVCEKNGEIVGYAYAHRFRERAAYDWNVELSIYISRCEHGKGIGKAMYHALIEILKLQNIINVYGGITLPNPKSEGLHKSMGFQCVGTYHDTGFKCGSWHSVEWFEKQISEYNNEPLKFISIQKIAKANIETILEQSAALIK
jgi:Sortase and related acyltransferases